MSMSNSEFKNETNQFLNSGKRSGKIITVLSTLLGLSLLAITYLLLQRTTSYTTLESHHCSNVCCDTPSYHSITEGSLDTMICNYRNKEWWKTCDAFSQTPRFGYSVWQQHVNKQSNTNSKASMYDSTYNSRYMDIGIDELENYLCTVRNNCGTEAKFLRFYFIRYGNECFKPAFANKHSLAMIPLDGGLNEIPDAKDCNKTGDKVPLILVSRIANHNEICPPEPPKGCSIRLNRLDSTAKSYSY